MEEHYIGYLIGALDDDVREEVEAHIAAHPEVAVRLEKMRHALEPLASDHDAFEPPADLVLRTVGMVAEHVVATDVRIPDTGLSPVAEFVKSITRREMAATLPPIYPWHAESDAAPPSPKRRNFAAMLGLTAALLMVGLASVLTMRQTAQAKACSNNLRDVHTGLSTYCDTHDEQYPRVAAGEDVRSTLARMQKSCNLSSASLTCPGGPTPATGLDNAHYSYNLGYRDELGQLQGVSRSDDDMDTHPLMADAPDHNGNVVRPINHRKGQNVLFAGGNVKFSSTPKVGPRHHGGQDNIFVNDADEVHAGKHRLDAVLGGANDQP